MWRSAQMLIVLVSLVTMSYESKAAQECQGLKLCADQQQACLSTCNHTAPTQSQHWLNQCAANCYGQATSCRNYQIKSCPR